MQVRPLASMPSPSLAASLQPRYDTRLELTNGNHAVWGGSGLYGLVRGICGVVEYGYH